MYSCKYIQLTVLIYLIGVYIGHTHRLTHITGQETLITKGFGTLRISDTLHRLLLFSRLNLISSMADAIFIERISGTTQLPRFCFDGDNRLDFLGGFPDVMAHFGFSRLIYEDEPYERPEEDGPERNEWDRMNAVALAKLKHYVMPGVHTFVWKGESLTAREYYDRMKCY